MSCMPRQKYRPTTSSGRSRTRIRAAPAADEAKAVQKPGDTPASNAKLDDIRARLAKVKNGLMLDGKYSCCISPSCDFCAMAMNGCPVRQPREGKTGLCGVQGRLDRRVSGEPRHRSEGREGAPGRRDEKNVQEPVRI